MALLGVMAGMQGTSLLLPGGQHQSPSDTMEVAALGGGHCWGGLSSPLPMLQAIFQGVCAKPAPGVSLSCLQRPSKALRLTSKNHS